MPFRISASERPVVAGLLSFQRDRRDFDRSWHGPRDDLCVLPHPDIESLQHQEYRRDQDSQPDYQLESPYRVEQARDGGPTTPGASSVSSTLSATPQLGQNFALFLHDFPQLGQRNLLVLTLCSNKPDGVGRMAKKI